LDEEERAEFGETIAEAWARTRRLEKPSKPGAASGKTSRPRRS